MLEDELSRNNYPSQSHYKPVWEWASQKSLTYLITPVEAGLHADRVSVVIGAGGQHGS